LADIENVLDPAGNTIAFPGNIPNCLVTGMEVSVLGEHLRSEVGLLVILRKQAWTLDQDLSLIGQLDLCTFNGHADRANSFGLEWRITTRQAAGLAHTPAFTDANAQFLIPLQG